MSILGEMEAITNRKILDECPDQFHKKLVALGQTFKKFGVLKQTGRAVQIPFQYRETNQGGWYDGSHTALVVAQYSTIAGGYLGWSYLYIDEYVNGAEMAENSGPEAFVDLMEKRGTDIVKRARTQLGTYIYTGTQSSNEITGFDYWLVSSGTIAQIDVSTYTTYASNLKTQTGGVAAMTKDDVNDLIADIYTDDGEPVMAFGNYDIWQQLQKLTESQVWYGMGGPREINADGFKFGGVEFYFDNYCPANKIYFIDPSTWRWIVNGPSNTYGIIVGKWHDMDQVMVDTKAKICKWNGQAVCIDPRKNGIYTISS